MNIVSRHFRSKRRGTGIGWNWIEEELEEGKSEGMEHLEEWRNGRLEEWGNKSLGG